MTPQMLPYSVLTFTPRPRDHGTNLTCQVQRDKHSVAMERTVRLNVLYAPQNLTIGISFRNITAFKILQTTSSLPILEGEAVRLLCVSDSNPPAEMSWFQGSPALNATLISSTTTLELPRVGTAEEGEFSCQARNPLGSQHVSFSLSVQRSPPPCSCMTEEQQGSWPLVLTLIRGALMGAGFLLTYGLTWLYYSRCGGHQRKRTTS
ncbi:sialic acid-binding Ig-like lectin 14 isoform X1 [Saccopteryx leptura]|uniref:sialic acid-binding Ig-like lectin 14 isoform X1 n=1 Tax=Saccopteryx leptura TaxID=249018 RepID=UPI00339BEA9D